MAFSEEEIKKVLGLEDSAQGNSDASSGAAPAAGTKGAVGVDGAGGADGFDGVDGADGVGFDDGFDGGFSDGSDGGADALAADFTAGTGSGGAASPAVKGGAGSAHAGGSGRGGTSGVADGSAQLAGSPAVADGAAQAAGVKTGVTVSAPDGAGQGGLPQDQNRVNAERRRKNEEAQAARERAAVDKAVAEAVAAEQAKAKAEMDEFFSGARLQNTITKAPINSMDDFRAWRRDYESAEIQSELSEGRLTPEALDRAIAGSPVMQRAQELIRQSEAAARKQQEMELQARVEAELNEIGRLDPSVRSLEDVLAMPTGQAFREAVESGNSFLNAFKLANFERLRSDASTGAAAAARQQAVTNAGGKDHLTRTAASRGGGSVPVPSAELAMFRSLMPDATEAEFRDFYNKRAAGG